MPLVHHVGAFVDHRGQVAAHDLFVAEAARRDAGALALGVDDGLDFRVGRADARAFGIQVVAAAGLLAEPAALAQAVGDLHVARLRVARGGARACAWPSRCRRRPGRTPGTGPSGSRSRAPPCRSGRARRRLPSCGRRPGAYTARMRLPMKPSQTPARTGIFFSFLASSKAVATTSALTLAGTTISSSFMMLAGEKKCRPITSCGREMLAAICVDVEVGGVRGQHRAGLADAVEFGEHGLLDGHVFEHRFDHQVDLAPARRSAVLPLPARHDGGLGLRRHAALGDQAVIDFLDVGAAARERRPRRARSSSTGRPASSTATAMPAPMVPPPMMPTLAIGARLGRAGFGRLQPLRARRRRRAPGRRAAGCRGIRGTACARAPCLRRTAGRAAPCTASMIFSGENRPRAFFAVSARDRVDARPAWPRVSAKAGRIAGAARRGALPCNQFARIGQAGRQRRRRLRPRGRPGRASAASCAPMWRPLSISSSAACAPIRRGVRCVPPAPGSRPSSTSGRPELGAAGAPAR